MIFKDKTFLKALWGGMFFLCALLGFVPQPTGANKWLLFAFGLLFFLPPGLLLYRCLKPRDVATLRLIRNISLISLSATLVLLAANILSMLSSEALGNFLYGLLVVISAPMICCQYWFVSLLLWATLLWCSIFFLKKPSK